VVHFWYLPDPGFPLIPCVVLLLIFIPISIWHERNWRRTLADYAVLRREAGAAEEDWPHPDLAMLMGVQLWLVLLVTSLLAVGTGVAMWAALLWPRRPAGFDMPMNYYDLPYVWAFVVAGTAAVVAGFAIAVDVGRSPWAGVARKVRRAIYAQPDERDRLFALALAVDPGVPRDS
jgi:hypothetical protein